MKGIEGFILTGGASSRMGTSKAHLRLGDQSFVALIAGALSEVASPVSVVSSRAGDEGFGLPVVADIHEGRGALGGLHAALSSARAPLAAVVSCDLPFVTGELFARLAGLVTGEFDAVVPVQPDGRVQPLCALYRVAPCRAAAEELIGGDDVRLRSLLARVRLRRVEFKELSDLTGAQLFFRNVNTPEDYASAERAFAALRVEG